MYRRKKNFKKNFKEDERKKDEVSSSPKNEAHYTGTTEKQHLVLREIYALI